MSFIGDGVVLHAHAHGETASVARIFCRDQGRCAGLVHGGQGRRMRPILQPGNEVRAEWKGRDGSLGFFALELSRARAAEALSDRLSLAALSAATALADAVLPEREAHPRAFEGMRVLLDHIDNPEIWPALMARWELGLLSELGFGLTLDRCASGGPAEDLIYASPKSACAVSRAAGEPYKDRLLALPAFLKDAAAEASRGDAVDGLRTTGYFLETRILHGVDRELPEARRRIESLLLAETGG